MFTSIKKQIKIWRYKRLLLKIYILHLKHPLCNPQEALYLANEKLRQIMNLGKEYPD